jgi:hypothetical protein
MKVRIAGTVEIRNDENYELVDDPAVAKSFDGIKYTEEEMADYIGDGRGEEAYAAIGLTGGFIELRFDTSDHRLWVLTEYETPRELTDDEIKFLVEHTRGQWSDGMGENMDIPLADEKGLALELYETKQTIRVEQT